MTMIQRNKNVLFALLCFTILGRVLTQLVGVDICACLPTTVTFRLNFTIECDETSVAGPGINETTCYIETRGNENVTDMVPISVSTVQVLELKEDQSVITGSNFDGGFVDGAEITYTSIVERAPDNITAATLPRGFQLVVTGVNAAEQTLVQTSAIIYTGGTLFHRRILVVSIFAAYLQSTLFVLSECGIFPLLEIGEQIGWVVFVSAFPPFLKT
jgi:hypothetical protein